MSDFTVAIITNGRCIPLLKYLITRWLSLEAKCIIGTDANIIRSMNQPAHFIEVSTALEDHGSSIQTLLKASTTEFTLLSADDILPIEDDFVQRIPRNRGTTISAIKLLSVTGDRWFDWAVHQNGLSYLQDYGDHLPGTYISGAAQLISKGAIEVASYADTSFRGKGSDVIYCSRAVQAGVQLFPPGPNGPTLIHLDRFTDYNRPKLVLLNRPTVEEF